jgi:hypothetical protein
MRHFCALPISNAGVPHRLPVLLDLAIQRKYLILPPAKYDNFSKHLL